MLSNRFTVGSLRSSASTDVLPSPPNAVLLVGTPRAVLGLAVPSDTVTGSPECITGRGTKVGDGQGDLRAAALTRPFQPCHQHLGRGKRDTCMRGGDVEAGTSSGSDPAGDQAGPVVAEVATGGTGAWGRTGRHGQVLASARERQADWDRL